MIQLAMIFAFGALAMGLFGAFFLPAYKKRAVRLAQRQLEARMPMSLQEVQAGRDALRAEAAAQLRAAEIKMANLQTLEARARAEIGRSELQISNLHSQAAQTRQDLEEVDKKHKALLLAKAEANAEIGTMQMQLHDSDVQITRYRRQNEDLKIRLNELDAEAQSQRASIAALETRLAGREMQLEDQHRELEDLKVQFADQTGLVTRLRAIPYALQAEISDLKNSHTRLISRHDKAKARIVELNDDLSAALEAKSHARGEAEAAQARVAAGQSALSRAQSSEAEAHAALLQHSRMGQDMQTSVEQEMQRLRVDNATLQGALQTLRIAHGGLNQRTDRVKLNSLPDLREAATPADFDALRTSIVDLGREMTRRELSEKENLRKQTEQTMEKLQSLRARAANPVSSN